LKSELFNPFLLSLLKLYLKILEIKENMFQKVKESKYTYLAVGILAGLAFAYVYANYLKKE